MVVDESGKIDPNAAINPKEPHTDADNDGEYTASDDIYDDWNDNGSFDDQSHPDYPDPEGNNASGDNVKDLRRGFHPSEIDLDATLGSDYTSIVENRNKRWFSLEHLLKSTGLSSSNLQAGCQLLFPHDYADETEYWIDDNNNNIWDYNDANGNNKWDSGEEVEGEEEDFSQENEPW